MHGLEEPGASQMRQPSRVIAIGLMGRQRLERLVGLPAFDADHGKAELAQPVEQDRRHASGLEDDPPTAWRFRQFAGDRLCRRRRLALANDNTFAVENADVVSSIEISRPAKYAISSLLFHILADRIGLRGRAPAHYPMLKNSNFRIDHNSGDRWRLRRKIP